MPSDLESAIETRLVDQCVLDEDVLLSLCRETLPGMAEAERAAAGGGLKGAIKRLPVIGSLARNARDRLGRSGSEGSDGGAGR